MQNTWKCWTCEGFLWCRGKKIKTKPTNRNFRRNRKMQKDPSKAPVRWSSRGICQTQVTSGKNRMSLPFSSCRKGDFLRFCCPAHLSHHCLLCFLHLLYITQAEAAFWLLSTPSLSNFLTYSPSWGSEAICRLLIWAVLSVLSAGGGETIMVLGERVGCRPLGRG